MLITEVSPERFAELFHHYQQALAPGLGLTFRTPEQEWELLPREKRNLSIAAARLALQELNTRGEGPDESRRYFAKPGEAEWGC